MIFNEKKLFLILWTNESEDNKKQLDNEKIKQNMYITKKCYWKSTN